MRGGGIAAPRVSCLAKTSARPAAVAAAVCGGVGGAQAAEALVRDRLLLGRERGVELLQGRGRHLPFGLLLLEELVALRQPLGQRTGDSRLALLGEPGRAAFLA